ncbi:MAG TPA: pyridoxal-phosphate dependent enzyme [Bryobacteraceae bacterium]|jgi:diaminopropionate ammonia-lyase|nr:pyridoxal-phosphate dependent enzyme [Bryobacteraceae bacterium]
MRFAENRFREPGPFAAPSNAAREFHRSLPGYAPTPLIDCRPLADSLGVRSLHVKDESHRFGLNAFKALGASWAMHRLARPDAIFSAATAGNHGRAVAWSARRLGRPAKIFVPSITIPARIAAIRSEGAEVRVVDGSYEDAVHLCDGESRAHGWQVISDVGYEGYMEIPKWVVEGYETLLLEYEDQRDHAPDVVIVQAGVGGLLCAAAEHFGAQKGLQIVSVEPIAADALLESISSPDGTPQVSKGPQNSIMAGLNCSEVSLTAWPSIRRGVDLFVAIEDHLTIEAMKLLAAAGIDSGESGAAGLAGLLAYRGRFQGQRVLIVNTEGHCT